MAQSHSLTLTDFIPNQIPFVIEDALALPIHVVDASHYQTWFDAQSTYCQNWLRGQQFVEKPGETCLLPDDKGCLAGAIVIFKAPAIWALASIVSDLPAGAYKPEFHGEFEDGTDQQIALGWGLAQYQFEYYRASSTLLRTLVCDMASVLPLWQATCLVRGLVTMPAQDMSPAGLAAIAKAVAAQFKADYSCITGEALLKEGFPSVHAVGRAASVAPRFVEINWGNGSNPLLCLVGKGVCFDTGGLDIKPANGMILMKKDMGGAAHVLGLAYLIMQQQLPVRLKVLIPAVENNIAGNAYRPGDIVQTRSGKTIEVGNTDAEGRIILADALTYACEHEPELIIDMATLTGAARVALGAEVAALFSNDQDLADCLVGFANNENDPIWQLPLHTNYRRHLRSDIADINNMSANGYGGAITAALFLQTFVKADIPWAHLDLMAYNQDNQPGRPKGGEAMGLRALYSFVQKLFCE